MKNPLVFLLLAAICTHTAFGAFNADLRSDAAEKPEEANTAQDAYYYFLRGSMSESEGWHAQAIEEYEKAFKLQESPYIALKLAELYQGSGKREIAMHYARQSVELDDSVEAQLFMARIYLEAVTHSTASKGTLNKSAVKNMVRAYRAAIGLDPDNRVPYQELAHAYLSLNQPDDVLDVIDELIKNRTATVQDHLMRAEAFAMDGREEKRLEALRSAEHAHPESPEVAEALGFYYGDLGNCSQAIPYYERVMLASPYRLEARKKLGLCYLSLARYDEAVSILEPLLTFQPSRDLLFNLAYAYEGFEKYTKALNMWYQVLRYEPNSLDARSHVAHLYALLQEYDRALAEYDQLEGTLLKKYKSNTQSREALSEVFYRKGLLHIALSHREKAAEYLRRAIRLSSMPDRDMYLNAIRASMEARQYTEALASCGEALSRFPKWMPLRFALAEINARDGRMEEASRILNHILESADTEAEIYIEAALFFHRHDLTDQAFTVLERALRAHPRNDRIFFQLGALNEREQHVDAAIDYLKTAVSLNTNNAEALNYLGYLLAQQNRSLDQALEFVLRAVNHDTENGAYLDSLGWVYFKMGHYEKALTPLNRAAELIDDAVILDHLGDVLSALGRTGEALTRWNKALEFDPEDPAPILEKIKNAEAL